MEPILNKCRNCDIDFTKLWRQEYCTDKCRDSAKELKPWLNKQIPRKNHKKPKWVIRKIKKIACSEKFYTSPRWRRLRIRVLKKYGRECMACGIIDGEMHVDHIKPKSKYPELALSISNLQVLCKECNFGKSNKYNYDFRC